MRSLFPTAVLWSCLASAPVIAAEPAASLADELRAGFFSRINLLGFGLRNDLRPSTLNPDNMLRIPRDQLELDLRPDFNLNYRRLELGIKPRFQIARTEVERNMAGPLRESSDEAFINEAHARYRLTDRLLLNYGRENLQWGPSALLSPSNPFYASNGRNNPHLELPGLDYGRVVFIPNPSLTFSLIANTGPGRLQRRGIYTKTYAVKADYTGDGHFISLLASHREGETSRVGAFAGWNVSDALIVHAEGSAGQRSDRLASGRRDRQWLVGAAYTLEAGPTLTAEFFLNNGGCTEESIERCAAQRGLISGPLSQFAPVQLGAVYTLGAGPLLQAVENLLSGPAGGDQIVDVLHPLARRRYAMLQYVDTKIAGKLNLAARLIRNLDDRSGQLVINVEYELGEHWQLYVVPTIYYGRPQSEFGSLLRKSLFVGASYSF